MRRVLCLATLLLLTAFAFSQTSGSTGQSGSNTQSGSMAQSGAGSGDEQQLLKIEQDWADAMKAGDADAVKRIEADNYVLTDADGNTITKQQDVNGLKSGDVKYQSVEISDLKAHVDGDN